MQIKSDALLPGVFCFLCLFDDYLQSCIYIERFSFVCTLVGKFRFINHLKSIYFQLKLKTFIFSLFRKAFIQLKGESILFISLRFPYS